MPQPETSQKYLRERLYLKRSKTIEVYTSRPNQIDSFLTLLKTVKVRPWYKVYSLTKVWYKASTANVV